MAVEHARGVDDLIEHGWTPRCLGVCLGLVGARYTRRVAYLVMFA